MVKAHRNLPGSMLFTLLFSSFFPGSIRTAIAWITSKYRNLAKLSLNDETYVQIRNKVDYWSAYCKADVDFTAWTPAIQKARILQLRPEDPWIDEKI